MALDYLSEFIPNNLHRSMTFRRRLKKANAVSGICNDEMDANLVDVGG